MYIFRCLYFIVPDARNILISIHGRWQILRYSPLNFNSTWTIFVSVGFRTNLYVAIPWKGSPVTTRTLIHRWTDLCLLSDNTIVIVLVFIWYPHEEIHYILQNISEYIFTTKYYTWCVSTKFLLCPLWYKISLRLNFVEYHSYSVYAIHILHEIHLSQ